MEIGVSGRNSLQSGGDSEEEDKQKDLKSLHYSDKSGKIFVRIVKTG